MLRKQTTGRTKKIFNKQMGHRKIKYFSQNTKYALLSLVEFVEIYVIFEVFAFCIGRTKTYFKDRGQEGHPLPRTPEVHSRNYTLMDYSHLDYL